MNRPKVIQSTNQQLERLEVVERLAKLLDDQFRLPGTRFRFGIDPLLGFIPFAGDLATLLISSALVVIMAQYGASRKVLLMMTGNVLLDSLIGAIPILGRIFDFTFKANRRNIELLRRHYTEGKYEGSGTGMLIALVAILLAGVGIIGYILFKITEALITLF